MLVRCGWCKRDAYPNELRYSELLDCNVCPDCDADDPTHGEIQQRKREQAKAYAWQGGEGYERP